MIGKDNTGERLQQLLHKNNIPTRLLISENGKPTTKKTRIIGNHYQMLRIDDENTSEINENEEAELLKIISENISDFDVVILQDYNKGLLTPNIISGIIELAEKNNIPTVVDPKKNNFFAYKNCTLFKPNLKEIKEGLNLSFSLNSKEAWINASQLLHEKLNNAISFLTLSEQGVFISDHQTEKHHYPAIQRNITDVSGAGDTVVSIAALALTCKCDLQTIAQLSNLAGGLVCEKAGVVSIDKEKLLSDALRLFQNDSL
jgi:rfaE bifunctional protein kinase chain/domain